jgi:hypothetical protein
MDAAVVCERLDIRDQATTEIVSQPRRLSLIKPIAFSDISFGIGRNTDDHRPSCIKRAFASGHAEIVARASSRRRLRSSSTSRCHSGDLTSQGRAQRLCHTLSRSWAFSATDKLSIWISTDMATSWNNLQCTETTVHRPSQNGSDQRLATTGSSIPLGFIASPLHRLVRDALGIP